MNTSMQTLLPIQMEAIGDEAIRTVEGRRVHAALEIGKDYSNWVKVQIERARLTNDKDFVVVAQKGVNPLGGRPVIEYHFTIEAAKHIAMISGTDKGFEVRDYFIACEKKLLAPVEMSRLDILKLALDSEQGRLEAVERLGIAAPKALALDLIADTKGSITLREAAKDLQMQPMKLASWLSANGWIYKQGATYMAYQPRINAGLMEHKVTLVNSDKIVTQARITSKGLSKLAVVFTNS